MLTSNDLHIIQHKVETQDMEMTVTITKKQDEIDIIHKWDISNIKLMHSGSPEYVYMYDINGVYSTQYMYIYFRIFITVSYNVF